MKLSAYARLATEQSNPRSKTLDRMSARQIIRLMNHEDAAVLRAIAAQRDAIARAAEGIARVLKQGGRLFFVGAGTSGRLGVLEAAECPPTFNTRPGQIQAIMAGGDSAVFRSKEGSEDSEADGVRQIRKRVGHGDAVVGIAASGVTPFVGAALKESRRRGAWTALLTCNPKARAAVGVRIALSTGPEVLAGSTRLKAGTACKMALNMMTTAAMVRLGKVFGNWMVDLQPKSRKLVARGCRLIERLGGVSAPEAAELFDQAHGEVKAAILMAQKKISYREALKRLERTRGFLSPALNGRLK